MATTEKVTLTDEQLADMREAVERFALLQADQSVTVLAADVEIADVKEIHIRYDREADEWLVEL